MTNSLPMHEALPIANQLSSWPDRAVIFFLFLLIVAGLVMHIRHLMARELRQDQRREEERQRTMEMQERARTETLELALSVQKALTDNTHAVSTLTEAVRALRT